MNVYVPNIRNQIRNTKLLLTRKLIKCNIYPFSQYCNVLGLSRCTISLIFRNPIVCVSYTRERVRADHSDVSPAADSWKAKHSEFQASIQYAKKLTALQKQGVPLSSIAPPPPSTNPDYIQCPHCSRRFNQTAAERHVNISRTSAPIDIFICTSCLYVLIVRSVYGACLTVSCLIC